MCPCSPTCFTSGSAESCLRPASRVRCRAGRAHRSQGRGRNLPLPVAQPGATAARRRWPALRFLTMADHFAVQDPPDCPHLTWCLDAHSPRTDQLRAPAMGDPLRPRATACRPIAGQRQSVSCSRICVRLTRIARPECSSAEHYSDDATSAASLSSPADQPNSSNVRCVVSSGNTKSWVSSPPCP